MAYEDLVRHNLGAVGGLLMSSMQRWSKAAMALRASNYPPSALYDDLRAQLLANWNTWGNVMDHLTYPTVPTVSIVGDAGAMTNLNGTTTVSQRLTGANFEKTRLESFDTNDTIAAADYVVNFPYGPVPPTDFDGILVVTVNDPVPVAGTYRGMVLIEEQIENPDGTLQHQPREPLAWVVVIAK